MSWNIESAARELLAAADGVRGRSSIEAEWPGFDADTAYLVQDRLLQMRTERGETVVGIKLGVTSRAKQRQVNVTEPGVAWLTDAMPLPAGEPVPIASHIQPRVEPEIAFVLGKDIEGPGVTAADAVDAIAYVFGALEIIDSRYTGYSFTMADATADNASSGRYVMGAVPVRPDRLDLGLEACLLEMDGEVVDSATGRAVLGNPAEALAFAANKLAERGHALRAGWVVLTGGMTDAVPLAPGRSISARFTNLGSVTVFAERTAADRQG